MLEPHSERHKKLIARGGFGRHREDSDGAHTKRPSSYSNPTPGRIPRNVIEMGHACKSQSAYKRAARQLGLPVHGASFPLRLARWLVEYLTAEDDLVFEPFAGSGTVGLAAEQLGRRWVMTDIHGQYVLGSATRLAGKPGFKLNAGLLNWAGSAPISSSDFEGAAA